LKRVVELYGKEYDEFRNNAAGAKAVVGDMKIPDGMDSAQAAAWTVVCSVILNLDETITKG
jgi:hypothetical protein